MMVSHTRFKFRFRFRVRFRLRFRFRLTYWQKYFLHCLRDISCFHQKVSVQDCRQLGPPGGCHWRGWLTTRLLSAGRVGRVGGGLLGLEAKREGKVRRNGMRTKQYE